ncbi:MAG: hypothetical protein KDD63_04785 [Bacteroidetes bacterium]|nr:hypothetical protein [Bacteroidota bacterium]
MANVDNNYLIEGFFSGTLTEEEEALFQEKMENDPDFAQTVRDLEMLESGLNALGFDEIAKDVEDWETNYLAHKTFTHNIARRSVFWRYSGIAASLLVLVGVTFMLNRAQDKPTSADVLTQYYKPYDNMITFRDSVSQSEELLQSAMEAYEAKEYQLAVTAFQEYIKTSEEDLRPYIYLGISQMELGNFQQADESFVKVMTLKPYRQQAQWYRVLTYLKADNKEAAIQYINEVRAETPDHYRYREMGQILKLLE